MQVCIYRKKMEEQGINIHIYVHLRKCWNRHSVGKSTEDKYGWVLASMDQLAMYNPRSFWFPTATD